MNAKAASIWVGCLAALWRDERAVTTVEYAMLMGVLVLGSAVAFGQLGDQAAIVAEKCSSALDRAAGMGCYPGG